MYRLPQTLLSPTREAHAATILAQQRVGPTDTERRGLISRPAVLPRVDPKIACLRFFQQPSFSELSFLFALPFPSPDGEGEEVGACGRTQTNLAIPANAR